VDLQRHVRAALFRSPGGSRERPQLERLGVRHGWLA
jgi:hypothetical protein